MTAENTNTTSPACADSIPQAGLNPYLKLIIGIALILGFIFGIGSLAQFIPGARHMARVIDERNLRATAIFYTDFEEPAEGSERIRDSLDYRPGSKP
ncbi:MAG: hypothetical protein KKE00_10160 [Proteobacteria bacterium]|nr:hypothetical protein [Pseudomonadota bacterium]MBU1398783.1 hypothetical protein [Pseudomonadota bacterium]MBU1570864.1 hypothetical protein [Pseudomonadota bacterium]